MSLISTFRFLWFPKSLIVPLQSAIQTKNYAVQAPKYKKPGKKGMAAQEKKILPVESDVNKLLTYVCGTNIYKEGEDIKLKPDSEYPDWLWSIRTKPVRLDELDPNTKEYWRLLRKHALRRNNRMQKYKKF